MQTSTLPLVVDLDGTLIRTDLLLECANRWVTQHPIQGPPVLLLRLMQGRAALKAWLAEVAAPEVATLPYHPQVVAWLQAEKAQGRILVLATASDVRVAQAVADHLTTPSGQPLFDSVLASQGGVNLKAHAKRDALVARFGEQGFEYVGNARADEPVWQAAAVAHVVSDSPRLRASCAASGRVGRLFAASESTPMQLGISTVRLHQWAKNGLVFVPLLAAHVYDQTALVVQAGLAFLAFGMAASGVYVLNDLVDLPNDRHHARKRHRPFASGQLSLLHGWWAWPLLLVSAFALAWLALPAAFSALLWAYVVSTMLYSFWLKQVVMVDVLTLALLYTLRIVGGALAITVPLSFWLTLFSIFLFLSLALIKRYSELQQARLKGQAGPLRGRGYAPDDLEMVSSLGGSAGLISVLVLALYIQDARTAQLYHSPESIWLLCPVLLYWISRAWLITHRGQMHDDPIVFALRDRVSWGVAGLMAAVLAAARLW